MVMSGKMLKEHCWNHLALTCSFWFSGGKSDLLLQARQDIWEPPFFSLRIFSFVAHQKWIWAYSLLQGVWDVSFPWDLTLWILSGFCKLILAHLFCLLATAVASQPVEAEPAWTHGINYSWALGREGDVRIETEHARLTLAPTVTGHQAENWMYYASPWLLPLFNLHCIIYEQTGFWVWPKTCERF